MAANSLLLFLLTTGLTSSPDQSVTTESNWGINTEEDAVQWHRQTRWPGYGQEPEDIRASWRQEQRYSTENHYGQFPDTPVTRESDDLTRRPYVWPRVTEEPEEERERPTLATEEPETETEQAQVRQKIKCPPREHLTKCHKNCEKTCDNYKRRRPCPRACKPGCVCDGGLVRNKEGKCVPRDHCPKKMMTDEDDDYHGCPYEYGCDVYCVVRGNISGFCEGDVCKCRRRQIDQE